MSTSVIFPLKTSIKEALESKKIKIDIVIAVPVDEGFVDLFVLIPACFTVGRNN